MYMNYVGDNVRARGQITATEVLIAEAGRRRLRRERDDDGRIDRHRRAVSVPLPRDDDRHRPAPRAGNGAGAARREPADVRLRRRRAASPIRSSPAARPSRDRSFSARPSGRARSDRSTRCRSRCGSPATATSPASTCAASAKGSRSAGCSDPAIRGHGVRPLPRRRLGHDRGNARADRRRPPGDRRPVQGHALGRRRVDRDRRRNASRVVRRPPRERSIRRCPSPIRGSSRR